MREIISLFAAVFVLLIVFLPGESLSQVKGKGLSQLDFDTSEAGEVKSNQKDVGDSWEEPIFKERILSGKKKKEKVRPKSPLQTKTSSKDAGAQGLKVVTTEKLLNEAKSAEDEEAEEDVRKKKISDPSERE